MPGFESRIWYSIVAPAGTPDAIVNKLYSTISSALKEPALIEKLVGQGTFPIGDTPQQFAATINSDIASYAALIKSAGIRAE